MKIIRHTARDMRQALRAVREQLGEDAVILSSRRTGDGVEVTAAVDFDASTLEAGGFANAPAAAAPLPPQQIDADAVDVEPPAAPAPRGLAALARRVTGSSSRAAEAAATRSPADYDSPGFADSTAPRTAAGSRAEPNGASAARSSRTVAAPAARGSAAPSSLSPSAFTLMTGRAPPPAALALPSPAVSTPTAARRGSAVAATSADRRASAIASAPVATAAEPAAPARSYHELAVLDQPEDFDDGVTYTSHAAPPPARPSRGAVYDSAFDTGLISEAAREAVVEHMAGERAPVLPPATAPAPAAARPATASRTTYEPPTSYAEMADDHGFADGRDPVEEIREATLTPLASNEVKSTFAEFAANANAAATAAPATATAAMSDELKTLRRMLENQLAHLAWSDLTRRAPVHTEILRELTEIGITQDLAEHLVRQLPEDQDLTFARRFTIAGLSQYLKVTGDRWLDDGGRVAFVGATGVGKTTTLAKVAVRWVLRHGARDIALVAADPVRIGAQEQLRSLAQMLGVSVYTPESFEQLPSLLSRLSERLILIDTPGSSVRDSQLAGRLAVLSNSASKLETALVLAASTQAGAIEETVRRFAPANPSCCVLTKLDEAASLGGVLSALIRARLPVSYMSEGQRVPEDLRPARSLELVSAAVRLAKARGAAADEDLLRRRFGKNAHGIS